jgi:hypothetical protein
MEATTVPVPRARQRALARGAAIPWHVYANLVAATSIVVGVLWDISWHRTIGRDSFWTPAHLAIYLGGVLGGASSGWRVLKTTFSGGEAERASAVHFWGFLGPLGAWVSIWGAGAMLTSAPFDDWWHNAYGLDVEILSPPHVLLAIGIIAIVLGATLTVLAEQNRAVSEREGRAYAAMFAYLMGVGVTVLGILATEHTYRIYLHSSAAYQIAGGVFPILLVAAARAGRMRWPATAAAAAYTAINAMLVWIQRTPPSTLGWSGSSPSARGSR